MRVKHNVLVQISEDADAKDRRFFPESKAVVTDEQQRQTNGSLSVSASSTETLSFGDVTSVKGLYLELSAAGKVLLNGSGNEIDVTPAKGAQPATAKLFLEGSITQVQVKNEDANNPLTGVYAVWGDPTP